MYRIASIEFEKMCGFKYTYALLVSIGCITATLAAALNTPDIPPNHGDPGGNTSF
jgi:hypothetical protein